MKNEIIRLNAWLAFCGYMICLIISVFSIIVDKTLLVAMTITSLVYAMMSLTGWLTRKYGLIEFKIYLFSRVLAIFTLIFGALLGVYLPSTLTNLYSDNNSYGVSPILFFILFLPALISSLALLFGKSSHSNEITK